MPLALRELQAAFAAHLAGSERADLAAAVVARGKGSGKGAARLAIHRHHVARSLGQALAVSFPTVQALVGADFFRRAAEAFVACNLPAQPVLAEYGAEFPDFVKSYAPARGLPYLADMARLDWALNLAFYSPRGARLMAADLARIPVERLGAMAVVLAPGTALLRSRYPIDLIWTASQPGASNDTVDIEHGAARLLVLRRPDDAGFIVLGEGEAAFVAAVAAGQSLEAAAGSAFAVDAVFDLSQAFARLLACEAFAALQQ